jgi:ornithine cyclodeaminase/alanine dehydrogenase-like protein (mu-crystallin family)
MGFQTNTSLILRSTDVEIIMRKFGLNELMDELILRLETAINEYNHEKVIIPVRSGFCYDKPKSGLIEWMPLMNTGDKVMIKVVGYHPTNPVVDNLPTILSTISAYDTSSGHLIGLADGVLLTALRTGAASAVASRYLAHPESQVLGLIGCGAQAITQLHAISRIYNLTKVLVNDTSEEAMYSFKDRVAILGLETEIIPTDVQQVVSQADILVTATTIDVGQGPLFDKVDTKPHLHVNAVGSDFPGKFELPLALLKQGYVCPDFPEQATLEGECQQLDKQDIGAGWVEVIQNYADHQQLPYGRTIFDSTGWPLEDLVVLELFLEYGQELGLGQEIAIEHLSEDVKNPYGFLTEKEKAIVFKRR